MTSPRTNADNSKWGEHLADENARSLTLVGERRSGLSSMADELLRAAFDPLGAHAPIVIRLDAQGLPAPQDDGDAARRATSRRCVEVLILLAGYLLASESNGGDAEEPEDKLVRLLVALQRGARPPLLIIDHFECLMSRLDTATWELLRGLVEQRKLQMLLLSRFLIREVDPLTGSRLFGVVPNFVVLGPLPASERQFLARTELLQNGVVPSDEVAAYLAQLGGGWRWLTAELGRLVARHASRQPVVTRETVDQAIAADRVRVREYLRSIAEWLEPERESDAILAMEMEREAGAIFELLFAPNGLITPLDNHVKRLQRLGHVENIDGVFRFSSPLMRSLALVRWRELRAARVPVDASYSRWWEFDEALRHWIRASVPATDIDGLVVGAGYADAVSAHRVARVWWGPAAGGDPLDELTAEMLIAVLRQAGFAADWLAHQGDRLELVSSARATMLHSKWNAPWSANRRLQEEDRLRALVAELPQTHHLVVSGRRVVRWLHISDLHLGRNSKPGEDYVLRSFLKTLKEDIQRDPEQRLGPSPDLVFFTGDLAHAGKTEEYVRAVPLLDELLKILGLERRHLFLVPGNHDVHRPDTRYLKRDFQNDEEIQQALQDERWHRLYRERLNAFDRHVETYFASVPERLRRTAHGFPQPQRMEVRGVKLLIHLLDPLLCGGLDDDQGKLLLGLIARRAEFADVSLLISAWPSCITRPIGCASRISCASTTWSEPTWTCFSAATSIAASFVGRSALSAIYASCALGRSSRGSPTRIPRSSPSSMGPPVSFRYFQSSMPKTATGGCGITGTAIIQRTRTAQCSCGGDDRDETSEPSNPSSPGTIKRSRACRCATPSPTSRWSSTPASATTRGR
ncbi:metallophosphoesterase [Nannocystis punicea]|uniref:Metallophosphoesterase n=1 Tax=Nannocystis punicea TaxID=2995304 RepID=A0ABY7GVL7_9BACT|nr:metallophosphoesterase [Nannocystis poenicansa]WAS91018.1 metallophosphoesterase [Nannocystis poenicansa]